MQMSLNNISLPPQLLADLYQHVLVQGTATAMPVKESIPFLGKNGKNILIVVNKKEAVYLPDTELGFLTTVLSACNLDLSHVAIVNWHHLKEKTSSVLLEQFSPKQVLLLDVTTEEFSFPAATKYLIQKTGNIDFVVAPSLPAIEKSKEEKKGLWAALKQLFCI